MNPGKLDKIITFQSKTGDEEKGDYGGTTYTWADYATVWAKKHPLRGRELMAAQAAQNLTEVNFYIRYLAGLSSDMRIVHDGNYYDITGIVDINEAHVEMEISANTWLSEG